MKKALKITGFIIALLLLIVAGAVAYVKLALPDTGPVQEITIERTPQRLERGEYLANHVTVCMDCHSTREWNLFAGPVKPGDMGGGGEKFGPEMGFPGTFYARNITPYALGDWTDGEIFRAVTTGVSKDGSALFPVMPYHAFGQMDTEDVYSIIAYIRSLKPVKNDVPKGAPDFPVSILINTMPAKGNPMKMPSKSDQIAYGKYLVTSASCVDCHSKTDKGNKIPGTEFGGGMDFRMPGGITRSANITPDAETGIGKWSEEAFVKRFKVFADSGYVPHAVGPNEMNSPMPWNMYAGMEEDDLKAIYAYLKTLAPIKNDVVKFQPL
ncbi:Alcohol dehydrogenase (quinone), cytochrome c subunit [Dyadobacter sp. CECT 9275]|uniref:Alcohol dehydrogenase (Quinone), cytochrome c subunit n=1 Tax=Dyadobacter helix TaxID=2822344 RepID=A0A916JCH0_9BACT|nr:c-type cytochrome [Dyadobacter sp. CECT 9275]CAG4995443.1 Alcohol dehydrogenase (quinone), cytochrome c subunit [Dyadobacter sp. CECT 9275]